MAISPTPRQLDVLRFIAGYQGAHSGKSPTQKEIARAIGIRSRSGVPGLLAGLEERGHLRRQRGGGGGTPDRPGRAAVAGRRAAPLRASAVMIALARPLVAVCPAAVLRTVSYAKANNPAALAELPGLGCSLGIVAITWAIAWVMLP